MSVPPVDAEIQTLLATADTGVFPVYGLDEVIADPQRYAALRELPATPADDRVKVEDCLLYT
ncbi:lipase, partial [Streptomyces varsoviensis]